MQTLVLQDQQVSINGGELISYRVQDHEFIHQIGDPGWGHSDTEMFPIIGPTAEAGYRVHVPRGNAILDQHGLLRELEYETIHQSNIAAGYRKSYRKGTVVMNSKYPERSTIQRLIWPFDFEFEKHFELSDRGLSIRFIVSGENDMPFMLGYHPAFKLTKEEPILKTAETTIGLQEVMEQGSRALEVADCKEIVLQDKKELRIKTQGFGHFMLWTEVPNMICIEPITYYPYTLGPDQLHEGFMHLGSDRMEFSIELIPLL